jgi:NAD-dependent dihydropyrimidine dehydrogenase PreA subunit
MREYRTVLSGVKTERIIQAIHRYPGSVQRWTETMLKAYPMGIVTTYKAEEIVISETIGEERQKLRAIYEVCRCGCAAVKHLLTAKAGNVSYGKCATCRDCNSYVKEE